MSVKLHTLALPGRAQRKREREAESFGIGNYPVIVSSSFTREVTQWVMDSLFSVPSGDVIDMEERCKIATLVN